MKHFRHWIPFLGILALIALFLKMPETPNVFGLLGCKPCAESSPYLPLIGCGYFALLIALSMLFPPKPFIARIGLILAILLALTLTYIDLPSWCPLCIIGHLCNISIWAIWWLTPPITTPSLQQRLFLLLLAPISSVALFASLNLTFMIYNSKTSSLSASLRPGSPIPHFTIQDEKNGTFTNFSITTDTWMNFVSSNCPYCEEQLSLLNELTPLINISPSLTPELIQHSPTAQWFEDKEGKLRDLFKVSGYPTLFLLSPNGTILQIIPGVPNDLHLR